MLWVLGAECYALSLHPPCSAVDVCSSSCVIWNISYSQACSCGKWLRVHITTHPKNRLASRGWRGWGCQGAATWWRSMLLFELLMVWTPTQQQAGAVCWWWRRTQNKASTAAVSVTSCSWSKSIALSQSSSYWLLWSNSINCRKKNGVKMTGRKISFKTWGFRDEWGFASPCLSLQPKWASDMLLGSRIFCRPLVMLCSGCVLSHDAICMVQCCVTPLAFVCLFPWAVRCATPLTKPICRRQLSKAGRVGI